jgi:hypothetical protein
MDMFFGLHLFPMCVCIYIYIHTRFIRSMRIIHSLTSLCLFYIVFQHVISTAHETIREERKRKKGKRRTCLCVGGWRFLHAY